MNAANRHADPNGRDNRKVHKWAVGVRNASNAVQNQFEGKERNKQPYKQSHLALNPQT
jgi:hypothetical protein